MKNEELVLDAELREGKQTDGQLRQLRKSQKLPAVIYGGKKPPMTVLVNERALRKAIQSGGANAILTLRHPKGEDTVILKDVAKDVVSHAPLHVDFQRISLKDKITVKVHLKIVGEAPGVKLQGGILEHILRELEIRCLPTEIPHDLSIDVSSLEIMNGLRVRDVKVPEGIEVLTGADQIVVNIVAPTAEEAPAAAAAGAEGAAPAEPEVVAAKGKKEEEGAEGAAAEKGKAAPAGGKAPAGEKKAPEKK